MRKKFWRHYRIFCLIAFVLIIGFAIFFWLFLSSYEQGRSTYLVQDIVDGFNKKDYDYLIQKIDKIGFTNNDYYEKILSSKNYQDVSFERKMGVYKDDAPVYSIKSNNQEIAVVSLKLAPEKGLFNINRWLIDKMELTIETNDISIVVPKGIKPFINGQAVDDSYIQDNEYYPPNIKNILNKVNFEALNEYVVPNVYEESTITLSSGTIYKKENFYSYDFGADEELLNSLASYLEQLCYAYNRYVSNEHIFEKLTPYLLTNTPTYTFLSGVKYTNVWSWNHTPTKFSNFELKNMQVYNDELFSVEITHDYEYTVYETNETRKYTANLTLLMVKKNGKWLLGDLTT